MNDDSIAAMTIGQLKVILSDNLVNTRNLLEKADLVDKVRTLVHNERSDRLRRAEEEEREKAEEHERQLEAMREIEERQKGEPGSSDTRPKPKAAPPPEKSGLCVVCQDDESCIASTQCGHLAMCKACSELSAYWLCFDVYMHADDVHSHEFYSGVSFVPHTHRFGALSLMLY